MKIASLLWQGQERVGLVDPGAGAIDVVNLSPDQLWGVRDAVGLDAVAAAPKLGRVPVDQAHLLPPVPRPPKLICVAANYLEHLREGGSSDPVDEVRPQLFMKPPSTTLLGHNGVMRMPRTVQFLDYEAELAVVIGKRLYQAADHQAASAAIAGYTAFNDISERKLKVDPRNDVRKNTWFFDWLAGKWLDGSAPMGPWLVTPDEVGDPQNLKIELRLNGQLLQSASTAAMMSGVYDIVWYASQIMTLEPGDVIATGTPEGVGAARGISIQPGSVCEVSIERIGSLITRFAADAP